MSAPLPPPPPPPPAPPPAAWMRPTDWAAPNDPGSVPTDRLYIRSQIYQARIKANDVVQEHLKQIVTVASAALALTVTFLKDVLGSVSDKLQWSGLLPASWIGLAFSILAAVLTLAALVNNLDSAGKDPNRAFQAGGNARVQLSVLFTFLSFGLGMLLLGVFAAKNFQTILGFQKDSYLVGSAVAAVEAATKAVPAGIQVAGATKAELINGVQGASPNLPVWHVQLEVRAPAVSAPAQVPAKTASRSSRRTAKSKGNPSSASPAPNKAQSSSIDYYIDAASGHLIEVPKQTAK